MILGLATVAIGCLILLTVVGVILKLVLDDIGPSDNILLGSTGAEHQDLSALSQGSREKVVLIAQRPECDAWK